MTTSTDSTVAATPSTTAGLKTVNRIQAVTGMALLPYTVLHLTGHVLAGHTSFGDSYLLAAREVYQNPVAEFAGAACLTLHLACGVYKALAVRKGRLGARAGSLTWFTRVSGLIIGLSMAGHIYYTRVAPVMAWGDSSLLDYSYIMFTRIKYGVGFTAYYIALGGSGVIHGINGARTALARLREGRTTPAPSRTWSLVTKVGVAAICSAVLGLTGYYWEVPVPAAKWFEQMSDDANPLRLLGIIA
ncbi:hypothetical protein AMAG_19119 [Allomyces macrogynus ATCC 38327]|uniref:Mitochondrial adapter protein MCP1 transmembrane domain-containing protein n=1 Tax=Allomyces macrogynus (strain ATCC 38327) TaxID=578462 RepID=A0A0L0SNS4_ALLM3|nr:hypothetical protein AMAG_19119 [Allomyces macrogynus ATCC 38327]|eukprot:KNE64147.1 hypothetical protein AMAG_19119 [Allomyces macrogynus ATCC 38327]